MPAVDQYEASLGLDTLEAAIDEYVDRAKRRLLQERAFLLSVQDKSSATASLRSSTVVLNQAVLDEVSSALRIG